MTVDEFKPGLGDKLLALLWPNTVSEIVSDPEFAKQVRGMQAVNIKKMTPLMMAANAINLVATVMVLAGSVNLIWLSAWALLVAGVIFMGFWSVGFRWNVETSVWPRTSNHRVWKNAFVLAGVWALLPFLFFSEVSSAHQIFITCIAAGMMGGGTMALGIVPRAARVFCWVVAAGCLGALIKPGDPVLLTASILLFTYVIALTRMASEQGKRFVKRCLHEEEMRRQRETIDMLLKDFEDSASDWMWETNAQGEIIHPSDRFCENLSLDKNSLSGRLLESFISLPQPTDSSELHASPLKTKLKTPLVFRDHILQIDTHQGPRWWSITGKPQLDEQGCLVGFRGSASDVSDWKTAQERLNTLAHYDQVTKLSNRNHFQQYLTKSCSALEQVRSAGGSAPELEFSVLYIDLDKFKSINDTLGHTVGDALLRETGNRIQSCLKEGDMAARFGGDEFAILQRGSQDASLNGDLADEILSHMARPFLIRGHTVALGCSIGVANSADGILDPESMMRNADLALYRAKDQGGNLVEVFAPGMEKAMLDRRQLETDLRKALKKNEFILHYQALSDVKSQKVNTYEALIRWQHPTRGLIMPDAFIPLAEETGLISSIGAWVLETACRDAKSWKTPHRVAVNVSAKQIVGQRLLMQIMETLSKTGLPPERLELEVTESVLIENPERTRKLFVELRKLGIGIALDDFGTGYSSLSYLVRFPFDKVKIDKSFIQSAQNSEEDLSIVRSILGLAKNLGIKTTAEGIEDANQLAIARDEGCDEMQGFLIQKPQAMSDIPELAIGAKINKIKIRSAA